MNEVIQNILTRRSVRTFSTCSIAKADIETLLEVAHYAPSGRNLQSWKFTAILNQDLITQLQDAIGQVLGRENYNFFHATALIIPSNQRDSIWGKEDNACALQNIFLAGHSMGISSVWINQLSTISDHPQIRPLLDQLEIPADHVVYGLAALGYDTKEPKGQVEKTHRYKIWDESST